MGAVLAVLIRLILMPCRYFINLMLLVYDTTMDFIGLHFGLTSTDWRERRVWKTSVEEMEFRERIVSVPGDFDGEPECFDRCDVINHLFEMNREDSGLEHVSNDIR